MEDCSVENKFCGPPQISDNCSIALKSQVLYCDKTLSEPYMEIIENPDAAPYNAPSME